MDDKRLLSLLNAEHRASVGYSSDETAQEQDDNLKRYLGKPYGDEVKGRSTFMSHDCAQVVDWALPDLLEPFVAGDAVVEFEPSAPEMVANEDGTQHDVSLTKAEQATDYINHCFFVDNNGFRVLHDVAKNACIQRIGIAKIWWDTSRNPVREVLENVSAIQLQELQNDDDVTIVEVQRIAGDADALQASPDLQSAYPGGLMFRVTVERGGKPEGKLKVACVPPDEFRVSARTGASVDAARYTCHETEVIRSDLVSMGFDQNIVAGLASSEKPIDEDRRDLRFTPEQKSNDDGGTSDRSQDKLHLLEEHIRADRNGDGIAELVHVFRVGDTLLEEPEEVSENPYAVFSPLPLADRLIGQSLVDKAKHVQRGSTVLYRQMLDNIYLANTPRKIVGARALMSDGSTIQALLNPVIGQIIMADDPSQIVNEEVPDRAAGAIQGLQVLSHVRDQDTGVTRNGMALDSEAIDPKSAYQSRKEDRSEQSRKRLMARVFAEDFVVPLCRKMLRAVVRYQDYERTILLRGSWTAMDPRSWRSDLTCKHAVGLGHVNKDEDMAAGMQILTLQKEALAIGMAKPEHLFNSVKRIVRAAGWRNPGQYFVDPSKEQVQQAGQGEDPKMAEVKSKAAAKMAELKAEGEIAIMRMNAESQIRMLEAEAQREANREKAQADYRLGAERIRSEYQLGVQKLEAEMQLQREQSVMEMELSREQMAEESRLAAHKTAVNGAVAARAAQLKGSNGMRPVRFGGEVG